MWSDFYLQLLFLTSTGLGHRGKETQTCLRAIEDQLEKNQLTAEQSPGGEQVIGKLQGKLAWAKDDLEDAFP